MTARNRKVRAFRENIKLTDTFPFGKHKDKNVGDLIVAEPEYLLWLRDQEDPPAFEKQIHELLDDYLLDNSNLQKKFKFHRMPAMPEIDRGESWGAF